MELWMVRLLYSFITNEITNYSDLRLIKHWSNDKLNSFQLGNIIKYKARGGGGGTYTFKSLLDWRDLELTSYLASNLYLRMYRVMKFYMQNTNTYGLVILMLCIYLCIGSVKQSFTEIKSLLWVPSYSVSFNTYLLYIIFLPMNL